MTVIDFLNLIQVLIVAALILFIAFIIILSICIIDTIREKREKNNVVVYCNECKYWTGKDYDGDCIKNGLATRMKDDFCSYGEKE